MARRNKTDKLWCVVFVGDRAVHLPIYGPAAAWAVALKYPGAVRRCYRTLREAEKAMEKGPDYPGEEPPPLF